MKANSATYLLLACTINTIGCVVDKSETDIPMDAPSQNEQPRTLYLMFSGSASEISVCGQKAELDKLTWSTSEQSLKLNNEGLTAGCPDGDYTVSAACMVELPALPAAIDRGVRWRLLAQQSWTYSDLETGQRYDSVSYSAIGSDGKLINNSTMSTVFISGQMRKKMKQDGYPLSDNGQVNLRDINLPVEYNQKLTGSGLFRIRIQAYTICGSKPSNPAPFVAKMQISGLKLVPITP